MLSIVMLHLTLIYFVSLIHDDRRCPFVCFSRFKAESLFNSFGAMTLLRDELVWGLIIGILASCFGIFQIAVKGERQLNQGHPFRFNMKHIWFFVLSMKNVLEAHSSRELFKISQELLSDSVFVYHGCWNEFGTLR